MASPAPMRRIGSIEIPAIALRTRTALAKTEAAVAAPVDNPIYKLIVSDGTPEEKRKAIAQYLTATEHKTENKARIQQWFEVSAWLEDEFQRAQKEILHLTDTEAFSLMQGVYQDMYGDLDRLGQDMKPLTDVLDALMALSSANKTFDAYLEIKGDEAAEAQRQSEREALQARFNGLQAVIQRYQDSIVELGEQKAFFGFGNVKKRARIQIAKHQQGLAETRANLDELGRQVAALDDAPARESQLGDLAGAKDQLKKVLKDVSSDGWKEMQSNLVQSALGFINKSKDRIGDVEKHLGQMTEQVDALYDTNGRMNQVYALVGDAAGDAIAATSEKRASDSYTPDNESLTERLKRNDRLTVIDEHAKALEGAHRTCATGFAETATEEIRLRTMRDANRDKIAKARIMATQGASSVSGQLATCVTAVSDAAIGQSESAVMDALNKMNDLTSSVTQRQIIQQSLSPQQLSAELEGTLKNLGAMREVVQAARGIAEQGIATVRDSVEQVRSLAEGLGEDSAAARAAYSDNQAKR